MKYKVMITKLFHQLGIHKMYKGCEYIISGIAYMDKHSTDFVPVTKVLYMEIAKLHHTSIHCVERDIRIVIGLIWSHPENDILRETIFGKHNLQKRPGNMEFMVLLLNHIKYRLNLINLLAEKQLTFSCPLSDKPCEYCKEFIVEAINKLLES